MATTKKEKIKEETAEQPVDLMQHMVQVYLPRAAKNEENFIFVGLNGKGYKVMRGQPVMVPAPVASIIWESERMQERQWRYEDEVSNR